MARHLEPGDSRKLQPTHIRAPPQHDCLPGFRLLIFQQFHRNRRCRTERIQDHYLGGEAHVLPADDFQQDLCLLAGRQIQKAHRQGRRITLLQKLPVQSQCEPHRFQYTQGGPDSRKLRPGLVRAHGRLGK